MFSIDTSTLLIFGLLVIVMIFIIYIYTYLFYSAGMYRIAKNKGSDFAWLAWIPLVHIVILPIMVENHVHPSIRSRFTLIYALSLVVSTMFNRWISIIEIVPTLILLYGFYILMTVYSRRAVMHLVICVVTLGLSLPLQVFLVRNNEPKSIDEPF